MNRIAFIVVSGLVLLMLLPVGVRPPETVTPGHNPGAPERPHDRGVRSCQQGPGHVGR